MGPIRRLDAGWDMGDDALLGGAGGGSCPGGGRLHWCDCAGVRGQGPGFYPAGTGFPGGSMLFLQSGGVGSRRGEGSGAFDPVKDG